MIRIGGENNFWIYDEKAGYDITHSTPDSPKNSPRIRVKSKTTTVVFDPHKTALVIIDLQNYFLSPALGRPDNSKGLTLVETLLRDAIPACRKADIPVVWLNWGLTDDDIENMPPTILKGFAADTNFKGSKKMGELGSDIGPVRLRDNHVVEGGRILIKDQWNSDIYEKLKSAFNKEKDMLIYKNRLSAFWIQSDIETTLSKRGIKTLLFAGANLDQCVGGCLQGAYTSGWDCLLLSDGTVTTSPDFARQCIEYNTEGGWGFVLDCKELVSGVNDMLDGRDADGTEYWSAGVNGNQNGSAAVEGNQNGCMELNGHSNGGARVNESQRCIIQ